MLFPDSRYWQGFCSAAVNENMCGFSVKCHKEAAMFFLLGNDKKTSKVEKDVPKNLSRVRELFRAGRFPVMTTQSMENKRLKVLGLVACRGYDSEEAFFGMAARAINKGAQAIIGYQENVAFHPDGSRYFSCYGTAVQIEKDDVLKGAQIALSA
jgi:hypothetical protein